ncbi:hypothetical protein [Planctomicrobium piriforme]|uniref:Response regulatory domain-containing protein n=1 Tax=Planctomicrobium piriforme TaxID=1576369 RepID=A0A1I3D900_9PLAN|nr:hypothetical protein [Planctomicrobium piriforme]SFH83175.1 hypothetical protein SAMN05421753_103140 [Planctomicrobium piriforme]
MSTAPKPAPSVLLLCRDLFFSSQLHGAVQRAGLVGRTCLSNSGCIDQLALGGIRDIIVDMETPDLDLPALRAAAGSGCRITVFAPHVKEELFAKAEQAGCDAILTRGQASSQLDRMLKTWNAPPPDGNS